MKNYDVIIIGAGIVGLASALKLKEKKPSLSVLVLDKEKKIAQHQSSHNSGVIHSGIYYKPGSLRAKYCIEGYGMMLDFLKEHKIPFDICGKIIVATSENESQKLHDIYNRGIENGLLKNYFIDDKQIKEIEPYCAGIKGIYVPYSGITDYATVAEKYAEIISKQGAEIQCNQKVIRFDVANKEVETIKDKFKGGLIINCAGLYSDKIAKLTKSKTDIKIIPFRGEYYKIRKEKEHLVKNLIYPVPNPDFPFLGVHFTRFVNGGVEAGPNAVLAFAKEGYKKSDINIMELAGFLAYPGLRNLFLKNWKQGMEEFYRSFSKTAFTKALQRLLPAIEENDLEVANAGVRACAVDKTGFVVDDFIIEKAESYIHVLNSPSPACTASLSIGKHIAELALN